MDSIRRNLLLPDVERWPADQPVIELRDVTKRFGRKPVIENLSLTIEAGKTTVIVGESGSGKSVLLRLMNGLLATDGGEVRLFGRKLGAIGEAERTRLRKRCTMVFQSYALIDSLTVAENVSFPLVHNTRMPRREIRQLVGELLALLEIGDAADLLPAALSGGMKKRVGLARAVVTNPEVVLFDEPTTGLDPLMIEFVDNLIMRTQREYQITSVIISHDMASNRRLADRVAMLSGGRIVQTGTFDQIVASDRPDVKAFMGNVTTERLSEGNGERADPIEPARPSDSIPTVPSERAPAAEGASDSVPDPVVRVRQLHKSFGANHVLRGIDLDIPANKITVIIGGSGSGKSVLVKHIMGLFRPDGGEVWVFDKNLSTLGSGALERVRGRIGLLFQGAALFDSMTVAENIAFPLRERRRGPRLKRREVREAVEEVAVKLKVPDLLRRYPDAISNGERKRVGLARAIVTRPDIVIYDEPTTGQDPVMMKRVDDMVVEAAAEFDITTIVISHDMSSTFRIADQIAMVHKGTMRAVGSPDHLRATADERVRSFIFAGATR